MNYESNQYLYTINYSSMKKYFLYTLIAGLSAFGFTSCNNGDYDANPEIDNSNIANPINPGNQPGVMLNSMAAVQNGEWKGYPLAIFMDTMGITQLVGIYMDGNWMETLQFAFFADKFTGAGVYRLNDTTQFGLSVNYLRGDATAQDEMENFTAGLGNPGEFEIEFVDEGNNRFRGTFSGVLYKLDGLVVDTTQKIEITDGKFFVERFKWEQ